MECKKCGHEMKNDECSNCGYYVGQEENYYFNKGKLAKSIKFILNLKGLYMIMIVIFLFRLDWYFNEIASNIAYGSYSLLGYLFGAGAIAVYAEMCFLILLAVILIRQWSMVFKGKSLTKSDYIITICFAALAALSLCSSVISDIGYTAYLIGSNYAGEQDTTVRIVLNSVSIIKTISTGVVFVLYFVEINKIHKSQNIRL